MRNALHTLSGWKLYLLLSALLLLNIAPQGFKVVVGTDCFGTVFLSESGEELEVTLRPGSLRLTLAKPSREVTASFPEATDWVFITNPSPFIGWIGSGKSNTKTLAATVEILETMEETTKKEVCNNAEFCAAVPKLVSNSLRECGFVRVCFRVPHPELNQ